MTPFCHHRYQFCLYRVRINVNFLRKNKFFWEISVCNRIKYTVRNKCINNIILLGISAYTFHLHFSRLCLRVFVRFHCVWSFLRPHKSCRNADIPSEALVQFLQAMIRITRGLERAANPVRSVPSIPLLRACGGVRRFLCGLSSSLWTKLSHPIRY